MIAEKFRDALHSIIGERLVFVEKKSIQLSFVHGYLNGVFECCIDASICLSDEEKEYLEREFDYIWDNIITWIKDGLDVKTEINRIGWNTREMENEWWYLHGKS